MDKTLHEATRGKSLPWSCLQGMKVLAYQRELVVIQRHVRLVQHLLLHDSSLPRRNRALKHIKLLLIPASILGLLSRRANLEDAPEELSGSALDQPASLEELDQGLAPFEPLAASDTVTVLIEASECTSM